MNDQYKELVRCAMHLADSDVVHGTYHRYFASESDRCIAHGTSTEKKTFAFSQGDLHKENALAKC